MDEILNGGCSISLSSGVVGVVVDGIDAFALPSGVSVESLGVVVVDVVVEPSEDTASRLMLPMAAGVAGSSVMAIYAGRENARLIGKGRVWFHAGHDMMIERFGGTPPHNVV